MSERHIVTLVSSKAGSGRLVERGKHGQFGGHFAAGKMSVILRKRAMVV